MSRSQHRCVFVGNIPYDATEEQLIQICEEVGPVVSFRLVLDRDTGKPKGYGFCEFRDEETALSARRNLQGYEINGRQLRVDFAENEKNVDRNREQGRGGPGFALTLDSQKQGSGVKVSRDPSAYQPVGIAVAAAAAVAMAGTLGGPQVSAVNSVRIGQLNSGKTIGNDPLTIHLASMTRHQLFEIVSQMKGIIQQNPQQARQILVANPQLTKALLQAQIMLGILGPSQVNVPTLSMSRPLVPELQAVLQSQAQASRTQPMQPLSVRSSCMQLQPIKSVQQGKIPQHQIPVTQNQMPQSVLFQPQMQSFHQSHSQMPTSQPSQTLPFLHHMQSLWQSQKGLMQPSLQNVSQLPPLTVSMSPPILSVQITQSQQPNLQKSQLPSMEQSSMSAQHLQVPVSQFHGPSDLTKLKLKSVESTGLPAARQSELQYRPVEPLLSNQSSQQPFQVSRLTADLGGGPSITQSGFPSSGSMLSGGVSMALGAHQEQLSVPGIGASAAGPPPSVTWTQDPQGGSVSTIAGILHSTASMVMTGNISASMDGNISSSNASNTDIGSIVTPVYVGNFPNATLPVEQDAKTHRESAGIDMTETSGGPITFVASSQGHNPMSLPPSQPQQVAQLPLELEQQKALLQQVMDLTLEQINSLPPEQREQVIQLQQAFRS